MVDEAAGVGFHQKHFGDEIPLGPREPLPPDYRRRARPPEDRYERPLGEKTLLGLVAFTHCLKVGGSCYFLQAVCEIARVPRMVHGDGRFHQVVHDGVGNRQYLRVGEGLEARSVTYLDKPRHLAHEAFVKRIHERPPDVQVGCVLQEVL